MIQAHHYKYIKCRVNQEKNIINGTIRRKSKGDVKQTTMKHDF